MLEKKHIFFKVLISVIMVTAFIMMTPTYKMAGESEVKIGDINGDGTINLTDLVVMLRHIAAEKSDKNEEWILTEEQMEAGDIIKDGKIDSSDVLALLRYMAANKSTSVAQKHKEWLNLEKVEGSEEKEIQEDKSEPKVEKIEVISKAGDYKTGSEIQIKVTFDEKIYETKNKVALKSDTVPVLNISFGEGEIKHPYVEKNSNIGTYIIYQYKIIAEDKGILKVNGAQAFDGTKTICDETGNEVTLIAGRDLTGNKITANEIVVNNNVIKEEETAKVEVSEVSLNKTSLNLEENNGERLTATIQPSNAINQEVMWISSNTDVVTVSETGFVTAKKEGIATITAMTSNGKTATCQVTVKNLVIQVDDIILNKTNLKLEENNGERLTAAIQPANATDQEITWISSNTNVATVSETGFVTAKKEGTATITAMTANGKTATCQVTVKNSVIEVTKVALDRTVLMLDKDHYNIANLSVTVSPSNATNKSVTWTSSNKNVVTVSKTGLITAKKEGSATITVRTSNEKTATCQVTVIGQMKKTTKGNGVQAKGNASGWWIVKKVNWSKEQLESYINNAATLCETGNYTKYPEAKAATLPYYTGSSSKNLKRKTLKKKKGISATNYLILVTTTNQQVNVFQKDSNGKWNLVKTCETSTGNASSPSNYSHNRFEFYLGAIYPVPSNDGGKGNSFIEFSQSGRGWHGRMYNIEKDGQEPYCAHRALHYGAVYSNGAPSSAGCIHLPYNGKFYNWLNKTMKGQYGTRIIVY